MFKRAFSTPANLKVGERAHTLYPNFDNATKDNLHIKMIEDKDKVCQGWNTHTRRYRAQEQNENMWQHEVFCTLYTSLLRLSS